MTNTKNEIAEIHLLPKNDWRSTGYIDRTQVNQSLSYYCESRPRLYGGCYVYQYIVMNDGTVYELSSLTASTRGIVANRRAQTNMLQRDIKKMTENAINY